MSDQPPRTKSPAILYLIEWQPVRSKNPKKWYLCDGNISNTAAITTDRQAQDTIRSMESTYPGIRFRHVRYLRSNTQASTARKNAAKLSDSPRRAPFACRAPGW